MTALVLLSYGRESEYRRAIMTILSFWGWQSISQPVKVLLFTDKPDYFAQFLDGLPVEYRLITPQKLTAMKGPLDFIHRVKIAVIEEAFEQLRPQKLLYVDSDTYFQADPTPLLAQISTTVSVMHTPEHTLAQFLANPTDTKEAKQLSKLLEGRPFQTSWGTQRFYPTQSFWNAGVLGLEAANAALLTDVYALTDEFYACSKWTISEQIAFSLVLQARTELIPASPYVFHYFTPHGKRAMDYILAGKITSAMAQLPLPERLHLVRQLAEEMPAIVQRHFKKHVELELQVQALDAFHQKQMIRGYRYSVLALLKAPGDRQFLKHVLYHTKRQLLSKIN